MFNKCTEYKNMIVHNLIHIISSVKCLDDFGYINLNETIIEF